MIEGTCSSSVFDSWIAKARSGPLQDVEIARLAQTLASSGEHLAPHGVSADLASTGGPGSISTIWGPAALVALGATVAKLGVPGRPAGGVDVLMQINGYRTDLGTEAAQVALERCGYVHLLAGSRFAPMDAAMFSYRQRNGAQHIPALAVASLLSKKIATGTMLAGLEVRVSPHGNFGSDRTEAIVNAEQYCRTARLLGMAGVCFLTDGTMPQQPYLGRGEALLALSHLVRGIECEWLRHHVRECENWCSVLLSKGRPARGAIVRAFIENVSAQGGAIDSLHERATQVAAGHSRTIRALETGSVRFELGALRRAIIAARKPDRVGNFDDSVGLILLVRPGAIVKPGDSLVSVRCNDLMWDRLQSDVAGAIRIDQKGSSGSATETAVAEVIRV